MAIYKEGKTWRADVYIHSQRIKQKTGFPSKKEARTWHDLTVLNYQPEDQELPKEKYFEEVIARFEEFHLPKIGISTRRRYIQDIQLRIRPIFGPVEITNMTPLFLEREIKKIFDSLAVKTANNCVGLLKTICNQGVRWNLVDPSVVRHIQMRKIHRKPYTWWQNKEDILNFLTVAKGDPYELAYRLGLECGMRLGEIVGLCKDSIDLENCHIHIHRQWIEKDRVYSAPKHGKNRYIRFERESELYHLLEESVKRDCMEQRLFLSQGGGIVSSKKLSQVYFQRLIAKSGVPKIRFHDLRHTFASWYMKVGGSIWELKGILGHADIQTTQKYAHLSSIGQGVPEIFK